MHSLTKAEQLTAAVAVHGEGPIWSPTWGGLRWVDMLDGDVMHLAADGAIDRWHVGSVAAAIRPRSNGGIVIAAERSFLLADSAGGNLHELQEVFTDRRIRFNEGCCDPAGNFLVGTMTYAETPGAGTVYRLEPNHQVGVAMSDVTVSNGLAWTATGDTAFYIDTATNRIDILNWSPELGLHDRRTFTVISVDDGHPDGLTVDAEGGVWVALWEGNAVRRYDPSGHLDHIIVLPVPKVTACTFGGDNLDRLFITTSRYNESLPVPGAGAIFYADPGIQGLPVLPYLG